MNIFADETQHEDAEPKPVRQPLGRRDRTDVDQTVLRIVGNLSDRQPLEVAAFQSFVE